METSPFGAFQPRLTPAAALSAMAVSVLAAGLLLELSRTLAARAKGRWYAGNGRDLFHFGAAAVLSLGFAASGLPPPLAALLGASCAVIPLLLLDRLPSRRAPRLLLILALLSAGAAPAALWPSEVSAAAARFASGLFPRSGAR